MRVGRGVAVGAGVGVDVGAGDGVAVLVAGGVDAGSLGRSVTFGLAVGAFVGVRPGLAAIVELGVCGGEGVASAGVAVAVGRGVGGGVVAGVEPLSKAPRSAAAIPSAFPSDGTRRPSKSVVRPTFTPVSTAGLAAARWKSPLPTLPNIGSVIRLWAPSVNCA